MRRLARLGLSGVPRRECAAGDRTVLCFTGDGGFYYHLAELETARRCHIPVVIIVNNNSGFGQNLTGVHRIAGDRADRGEALIRFGPTDFTRVARSFGVRGIRVEQPGEIAAALQQASPPTDSRGRCRHCSGATRPRTLGAAAVGLMTGGLRPFRQFGRGLKTLAAVARYATHFLALDYRSWNELDKQHTGTRGRDVHRCHQARLTLSQADAEGEHPAS